MEASETTVQETEVSRLRREVSILKPENQDLRTMLSTTPEHGDMANLRIPHPHSPIAEHLTLSIGLACCSRLPSPPKTWYTVPTKCCT